MARKNNKGLRNEVTRLKHKKRLRNLNLTDGTYFCYKAQGKPCSCMFCSPGKMIGKQSEKPKYRNLKYLEGENKGREGTEK